MARSISPSLFALQMQLKEQAIAESKARVQAKEQADINEKRRQEGCIARRKFTV